MNWDTIKERLKSPVVLVQIFTILAGAVVLAWPELEASVKIVVGTVVAIYNVFAGINNPTDKENF